MICILNEITLNKFKNICDDILSEIKNYEFNSRVKAIELEKKVENKITNDNPNIVLDRIEGNIAVCEVLGKNNMIGIPKEKLPLNVKEGNILRFENGRYIIDFNKTEERKNYIEALTKNLWND